MLTLLPFYEKGENLHVLNSNLTLKKEAFFGQYNFCSLGSFTRYDNECEFLQQWIGCTEFNVKTHTHVWDLLDVNYSLNNGLYCTKWMYSHLLFGQLFDWKVQ